MIAATRVSQRMIVATTGFLSRRSFGSREADLPVRGPQGAAHLTSVLRLNIELPHDVKKVLALGYRYPRASIHVTVRNLDLASHPVEDAVARLERVALRPVAFSVEGLGCSPDTIFLRCTHGPEMARLRSAVDTAFGLPTIRKLPDNLFLGISFANVVRFEGPGYWPGRTSFRAAVSVPTLEIVRTDKYLSDEGTTTLAKVSLAKSELVD